MIMSDLKIATREPWQSPDEFVGEFDDSLISDADIVPDDLQGELIGWRDTFQQGAFRIGDIANTLIINQKTVKYDGSERRITSMRIYKAVGRFCGKSGRTVRYYAETSAFYSANIRTEFEVVPFSHFVLAKTMGDKWRDVLEYSAVHPDYSAERVLNDLYPDRNKDAKREECNDYGVGVGIVETVTRDYYLDILDDGRADEMREYSHDIPSRTEQLSAVSDLIVAIDRFERFVLQTFGSEQVKTDVLKASTGLKDAISRLCLTN